MVYGTPLQKRLEMTENQVLQPRMSSKLCMPREITCHYCANEKNSEDELHGATDFNELEMFTCSSNVNTALYMLMKAADRTYHKNIQSRIIRVLKRTFHRTTRQHVFHIYMQSDERIGLFHSNYAPYYCRQTYLSWQIFWMMNDPAMFWLSRGLRILFNIPINMPVILFILFSSQFHQFIIVCNKK